jgi:sugar/nucleoside kinase (ribokinase family)
MLTERGANAELDLDAVPDSAIGSHLHLTGYSLFEARDDGAAFARLIARARGLGASVSVTPGSAGFIADFGVERFRDRVADATVLLPNLEEGRLLTGRVEPGDIVAALDFPVVALTLGAEGVFAGGSLVPAVPANIVDPTGAGDAFAAGFVLEWVGSGDVVAAASAGARAAASAVETIGGRPPA